MSKPEQSTVEPSQSPSTGPFASVVGTVVGGVLGLIVLVLLVSLLEKTPTGPVEELPHAVVMVEIEAGILSHWITRRELGALQRRLEATKLSVSGPLDYPILVPSDKPGAPPVARPVDEISDLELQQAQAYLASGGWLVPRVYSESLQQVVFRIAPPGRGAFPSGTLSSLRQGCEAFQAQIQGANVFIYSRALGAEDDAARSRINISFGVQTAPVSVRSMEGRLWDPQVYGPIVEALGKLRDPRIRSVATFASWVTYVGAVTSQDPALGYEPTFFQASRRLAEHLKLPAFLDPEGKNGVIDVTTEAEGKANLEVANMVAAHAQGDGFNAYVARNRK